MEVWENNRGVWEKNGGVWANEVLTSICIEQTGLGLYIGNMLKSMKGASKALEARLELDGRPNFFPSARVVTTREGTFFKHTIIVPCCAVWHYV